MPFPISPLRGLWLGSGIGLGLGLKFGKVGNGEMGNGEVACHPMGVHGVTVSVRDRVRVMVMAVVRV